MFQAYTSGGAGFMTDPRFHRDLNIIGNFGKIACKVDKGISEYAINTKVNVGKPVTSSKTKMRTIKVLGKQRLNRKIF